MESSDIRWAVERAFEPIEKLTGRREPYSHIFVTTSNGR
jgi:hypothetical protein